MACGQPQDRKLCYTASQGVDPQGWHRNLSCDFAPWPTDSAVSPTDRFDVVLAMRHTASLPYRRLWLKVETLAFDSDSRACDTIVLDIPASSDRLTGSGSHGISTVCDTLLRNAHLPEGYRLSVTHLMQQPMVPGISDFSVLLYKR